MRQFHPPILIPPRQPIFHEPVPVWAVMFFVACASFAAGVAFVTILERLAP